MSAVTTKPTYAKERNMRGGCRDKAICSKRFVVKEELHCGNNPRGVEA